MASKLLNQLATYSTQPIWPSIQMALILVRERATICSRLPPVKTGAFGRKADTEDRGNRGNGDMGVSDLQASPLSERDRESWETYIK
jgi:hypothetical protein